MKLYALSVRSHQTVVNAVDVLSETYFSLGVPNLLRNQEQICSVPGAFVPMCLWPLVIFFRTPDLKKIQHVSNPKQLDV